MPGLVFPRVGAIHGPLVFPRAAVLQEPLLSDSILHGIGNQVVDLLRILWRGAAEIRVPHLGR